MQKQDPLNEPLGGADGEFEAALRELAPARGMRSAEHIAYEAGRSAGRRGMSVWRGVSAALAAGLALVVCLRPTREVGTVVQVTPSPQLMQVQVNSAEQANALQLVRVQVSSAEQASAPRLTPGSYLSIRDQVLTGGLDMLHPAGASGPRTPMPQVIDVQPYDFHLPSVFGGNS